VTRAAIGLGANVGDARATLERAIGALGRLGHVAARSSFYRTAPWGVTDQAEFVNAAALLDTELEPFELLAALKALEREFDRVETYRWGPREIDLDILTYGELALRDPDLTVPHARLFERAFALAPLAEIDPSFAGAYAALPAAEREGVQRIPASAARTKAVVDWDVALQRVRTAAEFCASAGLTRFKLEEDGLAVEVRRRARPAPAFVVRPDVEPGLPANGTHSPTNGSVPREEEKATVLKAEFVGIVRFSRPTVSQGAHVAEDRELAYVESLGIRNPIRSGGPGRVTRVFVSDGQSVEYGQPLFAIES
jgi:2-amino-4-hydroxy-6-hydroxymethyldihydropteridine diphosphokinase